MAKLLMWLCVGSCKLKVVSECETAYEISTEIFTITKVFNFFDNVQGFAEISDFVLLHLAIVKKQLE